MKYLEIKKYNFIKSQLNDMLRSNKHQVAMDYIDCLQFDELEKAYILQVKNEFKNIIITDLLTKSTFEK